MVEQDWNILYIYIGGAEPDIHIMQPDTSVFIHVEMIRDRFLQSNMQAQWNWFLLFNRKSWHSTLRFVSGLQPL